MRNRTSLVLMEQLVMVLVFALAAALCLGVFVQADRISRQTRQRDEAVLLAQNGAEVLKSCAGDRETAVRILNGTITGEGLQVLSRDFRMDVEYLPTEIAGLGKAQIRVYLEDELLFELQTGWQEVGK